MDPEIAGRRAQIFSQLGTSYSDKILKIPTTVLFAIFGNRNSGFTETETAFRNQVLLGGHMAEVESYLESAKNSMSRQMLETKI